MYMLRRAALRTLSAKPSSSTIQCRTFISQTTPASRVISSFQTASRHQIRWASNEASPTDAESSGETVTTEPSEAEQQEIREESIATPETADAADTHATESSSSSTIGDVVDAAKEQAGRVTERVARGARDTFGSSRSSGDQRSERFGTKSNAAEPSKIIYVGNLFFEVNGEQLAEEFGKYGTVVNSKVAEDGRGLSRGFGYVEFDSIDSAAEAIRGSDQQVLSGRRMAVQYHVRRERDSRSTFEARDPNPPSKTLFIGNMSFQMSDKELNDLFREIRNVIDVRVAIDRKTGQPRGFAHADFVDVASAQKAKEKLAGKQVHGRSLRIDFSKEATSYKQVGQ